MIEELNKYLDRLIKLKEVGVNVHKEINQCLLEIKKELGLNDRVYISVDVNAKFISKDNRVVFTEEFAKELKKQLNDFQIKQK